MKTNLVLEAIGHDTYEFVKFQRRKLNDGALGFGSWFLENIKQDCWVAKVVGHHSIYGYARIFLQPKVDYRNANSIGSRGVELNYLLESGYVYEVREMVTWTRIRHYFCTVTDEGEIIEINKEQVEQWVKDHSVSMS